MKKAVAYHPSSAPKSVTILGATGSIGKSTVALIEQSGNAFCVEAITAHDNAELLANQAKRLNAKFAVIGNSAYYPTLKSLLSGSGIDIACGEAGLIEAATRSSDIVMSSIVGAAGLAPTLAAIRRGATIALANKECLVCAGNLMMQEIRKHNATLIPVDSEHNALFQVFDHERKDTIEKIIITASGGPFRNASLEIMQNATPEDALKHPNWNMGAKITIDSATMMNKGLEMIEAYHLFPLEPEQIEIIVHPESIVHSLVAYIDGSVLAQLSNPDMTTPIAYALAWPNRITTNVKRLNLTEIKSLTFEAPDETRFPALRLAKDVLKSGSAASTVMNAANEIAVHAFLDHKIGFLDIISLVEKCVNLLHSGQCNSIEDVVNIDHDARELAQSLMLGS